MAKKSNLNAIGFTLLKRRAKKIITEKLQEKIDNPDLTNDIEFNLTLDKQIDDLYQAERHKDPNRIDWAKLQRKR